MDSDAFEYVGFWIRVATSLIDSLLVIAVTTPLVMFLYGQVSMDGSVDKPLRQRAGALQQQGLNRQTGR